MVNELNAEVKAEATQGNFSIISWVQSNTAICTTIVLAVFIIVAILRWDKVKSLASCIMKETYYRRIVLVLIPLIVATLLYIYPARLSAFIILLGYITSASISEKATAIAVEKKSAEMQLLIDESNEENGKLKSIINDKKTHFIDKILTKLQSIQISKKIKTKDDAISEISKLSHRLMAEKTFFESADEALTNFNVEALPASDLANDTIIK